MAGSYGPPWVFSVLPRYPWLFPFPNGEDESALPGPPPMICTVRLKHEATARSLALANCSGFSLAELFDQKCEKIPPPSTKSS